MKLQLMQALPRLLNQKEKALSQLNELINQASPERILSRGFALIKKDGKILSDTEGIKPGDILEINTSRSVIETEVKRTL